MKHPRRDTFGDIVYVTANPYVNFSSGADFTESIRWDYGWDDGLATVLPKRVMEDALKARSEHPDRRLIVHFMQPHFPALTGRFAAQTGLSGLRSHVLNNSAYREKTVEDLLEESKLTRCSDGGALVYE